MRNSIIRGRCGCELRVVKIVERNVLKWFGRVERMGEGRLVKRAIGENEDHGEGRKLDL